MTLFRSFSLLIFSLAVVVSACDSPTGNFDRNNTSDPKSVTFDKEGTYDLVFDIHSDGMMLLSWGEVENFVEIVIVKKSLGDSLSFEKVAEIDPEVTQWQDTSGVIDRLMYYKIETHYTRNNTQQKYGEAIVEQVVGKILDFSFEINNENETLDLNWVVDVPFFSNFIIQSANATFENGENSIELPGNGIENSYSDRDPNITFAPRNYTLTGIIEGENGSDDIIVQKIISTNLKSVYKPKNLDINVINEQNWLLSWEGEPYFSDGIKISRSAANGDWYTRNLQTSEESLMDSLLSVDGFSLYKSGREYKVSFISGDTESNESSIIRLLDMSRPTLKEPLSENSSEQTITITWGVNGSDSDKIKEFIIEKRVGCAYTEVARVPGDTWQFTENIQDPDAEVIYRVKTLTTDFGSPKEFRFVNNYNMISSLESEKAIGSSLRISSDGKYLSAISLDNLEGEPKFIEIWNIDSGQKVQTIHSEGGRISDLKISHDDKYIYYVVPAQNAIYRRDFPDGGNPTKIIENASLSGVPVTKIDVSNDGAFLLGTAAVGFVKRWNLDTFDLQFSVAGPDFSNTYSNIALSNDNTKFVINAWSLLLKNATNGETLGEVAYGNNVKEFTFSRSDRYISHITRDVNIFSILTDERFFFRNNRGMDFHPDDESIIIIYERDTQNTERLYRIYFYDLEAKSRVGLISNTDHISPQNTISKVKFIDANRVAISRHAHGNLFEIWEKMDTQQWKIVREVVYCD